MFAQRVVVAQWAWLKAQSSDFFVDMSAFEDVAGESSSEQTPPVRPPAKAGRAQWCAAGPLRIFIIVARTAGLWAASPFQPMPESDVLSTQVHGVIVGTVLAHAWRFKGVAEAVDEQTNFLHDLAAGLPKRSTKVLGFIDYPVEAAAELHEYVEYNEQAASEVSLSLQACHVRLTMLGHARQQRNTEDI